MKDMGTGMKGEITLLNNTEQIRDIGLYIHIPFCVRKCDYCDFLSAPAAQDTIDRYFDAMLAEIEQYQGNMGNYIVRTIFFGGGTPSVVNANYIGRVMESLSRIFRIDRDRLEATMEMNPGTVTQDKLRIYRSIGINRISFGLQSTDDKELSLLGRIHTYDQFEDNYYLARNLGFHNINIDLMSALPGQTLESWEKTLNKVIALNPEHISAYSLIIEEGTKFYEQYHNEAGEKELPDEDTDRLIYHRTKTIMQSNGYHRYEISNYAKPGFECRHNSSYWIGTDYLGIGLGASSLLNGTRFSNTEDLGLYINKCNESRCKLNTDNLGIRTNQVKLTKQERMGEFMFLGLRMCDGISREDFYQSFGFDIDTVYGSEIQQLEKKKLIRQQGDRIFLTDYGIDISNYVFSMFLKDETVQEDE